MTVINNEDWLQVLENTDYEPAENTNNTYQSYRFVDLDLETVTINNYKKKLMPLIHLPVQSGSNKILKNYSIS